MARQLGLTIIIGIILTTLIVSLSNIGMGLIYERPDYSDYCEDYREKAVMPEEIPEQTHETCQPEYEDSMKNYNQIRFYVFSIIGFILLLLGLWHKELLIQITGLATGGILVLQGVVMNLENKLAVFVTLLLILAVFGVLGYRLIGKMGKK